MTKAADIRAPVDPNWVKVQELTNAVSRADTDMTAVLSRLYGLGEAWRSYRDPLGTPMRHTYLFDFLVARPTAGPGMTGEQVALVEAALDLDSKRPEQIATKARKLLAELALSRQSTGAKVERASVCVDNSNINAHPFGEEPEALERPTGTTVRQAIRSLDKHAPELLERVIAGEMSAHRAMVEAGLRPRTISVRTDDMEKAAGTLRRNLTTDQLAELRRHLEP